MDNRGKEIWIGFIGVISYLVGDIDGLFTALLICMVLDFTTGIIVAVVKRRLSSKACAAGIAKKILMLFIVAVGHIVDCAVIGSGETVRNIVVGFYLANECISLLENSAELGVKYPDKLTKILEQLNGGESKE